ncbi:MAG TPA: hypothetical protein VND97_08085 [Beijerinckiaceae bacterium]|nr:hypothetical protein [Beijerinckiaceae bacterium]
MHLSDLRKLLDTALHKTENPISLTMTDLPKEESQIRKLLDGAIGAAHRNRMKLTEIQLSMSRYPTVRDRFLQAPITESGDPEVLRLIYGPSSPS